MSPTKKKTIAIIGGGASGYFLPRFAALKLPKKKILMLIFASLKQPQVF